MSDIETTARETLLERAKAYKTAERFDGTQLCYFASREIRWAPHAPELVVPAEPYKIGPAMLTMSPFNSLILNSPNVFIADIDRGDPQLSCHATVESEAEIISSLEDLARFDEATRAGSPIAGESWRLYRTHSGFRLICTSRMIDDIRYACRLLGFLRADPKYIDLCEQLRCCRARLTPKPWRDDEYLSSVCCLIETIGTEVHPEIAEQLRLHDELTTGGSASLA